MNKGKYGRRGFLKSGAALVGGLAAGGIPTASGQEAGSRLIHDAGIRPLGEVSRFESKTVRRGFGGSISNALTPHQDLHGIITPSELHFIVNHENGATPDIDPRQHRLLIHGMVDRPVELTMDDIKLLPSVSRICFVECNGNSGSQFDKDAVTVQDIHGRSSCAEWTGVPLSLLLKEVGVKAGAEWLIGVADDPGRHGHSFPMSKAMDDAIVAYAQNGQAMRIENGYPLRLILPGWSGRINVKWLNRIKVVDEPYMNRQESFAYMEQAPLGMGAYSFAGAKAFGFHHESFTKSVITYPSGGQRLAKPGMYQISGLAWSGGGAIRKVEVSADDGRSWKEAELQAPVLSRAFTRFTLGWKWDGGEAILKSRSTDERGNVQPTPEQVGGTPNPTSPEQVAIWGADTSATCRNLLGDELCSRLPVRAQRSIIQSWRVNRDGNVTNPMPAMADKLAAFLVNDTHEH
ncbi:MAG: sulfite dehydrogenase [Acidobacteria bacterium]|nr:sulfite dehydrogenase [Acidobacteriota bacterium]